LRGGDLKGRTWRGGFAVGRLDEGARGDAPRHKGYNGRLGAIGIVRGNKRRRQGVARRPGRNPLVGNLDVGGRPDSRSIKTRDAEGGSALFLAGVLHYVQTRASSELFMVNLAHLKGAIILLFWWGGHLGIVCRVLFSQDDWSGGPTVLVKGRGGGADRGREGFRRDWPRSGATPSSTKGPDWKRRCLARYLERMSAAGTGGLSSRSGIAIVRCR